MKILISKRIPERRKEKEKTIKKIVAQNEPSRPQNPSYVMIHIPSLIIKKFFFLLLLT